MDVPEEQDRMPFSTVFEAPVPVEEVTHWVTFIPYLSVACPVGVKSEDINEPKGPTDKDPAGLLSRFLFSELNGMIFVKYLSFDYI